LREEGRLLEGPWWLDPQFRYGQTWFQPKHLTREELSEGCHRARMRFYSWPSILRRALNFRANTRNITNAFLFLAVNLILKREQRRRHGKALGSGRLPQREGEGTSGASSAG
jgi:hypothetical protein